MKKIFYSFITFMIIGFFPVQGKEEAFLSAKMLRETYGDIFKAEHPYPTLNQNHAKIGKKIFNDPRLSQTKTLSCATCHQESKGFSDGFPTAIGKNGKPLLRHSMSLYNLGDDAFFFWDGRAKTLKEQFLMAISNPEEMDFSKEKLVAFIRQDKEYRALFAKNKLSITLDIIANTTASYVASIQFPKTRFDDFLQGDNAALTPLELKGFELFNNKANCTACHKGIDFTDNLRNDIGLPDSDKGYGDITKDPADNHFFKTPSLRQISKHPPYMHNGSLASLKAVVKHYNNGTFLRGDTDIPPEADQGDIVAFHNFAQPLNLTKSEEKALVAFLKTL